MTLQQLRYLIAIAQHGSISAAAHRLYISQSGLSLAVKDIERECGVTIFERSSRGIALTPDGAELLSYARQVVEQADLMEARYSKQSKPAPQRLAVASQHFAFTVEAFLDFVKSYDGEGYSFSLRETRTADVIEEVREFRSDLGIIYLSSFNEQPISKALDEAGLSFTRLFQARPHIFVGKGHPLAGRLAVRIDELEPYPRYSFDQGAAEPFFAEEPFAELPHQKRIAVSDRGTLANLLAHHDGYTVSTGILSSEMQGSVVAVPLDTREHMVVGYIVHNERQLSAIAQRYLETLKLFIEDFTRGFADL